MSTSTLQAIWPGEKHENVIEYHNSWGTAPIIWETFCTRYLKLDKNWWLFNSDRVPNPLWDAWKRKDIPKGHRAVLLFTLDHIYVRKPDYRRFAKDLREFLDGTMISANRINHWPRIAQQFEMDRDFPGLALWCTSVTSDPWLGAYNETAEDYDPFDWSRAYDLYVELDGLDQMEQSGK